MERYMTTDSGINLVIEEEAQAEIDAAKKLCGVYFKIASELIGEDEVRFRREGMLRQQAEIDELRRELTQLGLTLGKNNKITQDDWIRIVVNKEGK